MRLLCLVLAFLFVAAQAPAQAPAPPPPSCEAQLNGAKFTLGGEMQQHAITVEKLRAAEAELAVANKTIAELKAATDKKPAPAPEKKPAPAKP